MSKNYNGVNFANMSKCRKSKKKMTTADDNNKNVEACHTVVNVKKKRKMSRTSQISKVDLKK